MGWGRIDDTFDDHPKVVALLDEDDLVMAGLAIGVWTLCFTWAHRNTRKKGKTPGLVPAGLPRRFFGPAGRDGAAILVKHGLWEPVEGGGWQIHDFDKYLPTEETREARSEAGKRGAAKRWANHHPAGGVATDRQADGNLPSDDGSLLTGAGNVPSASHAADSKGVASDGSRAPARRAIPKGIAPTPTPTPKPVPPSAGAAAPAGGQESLGGMPQPELTETQRSKLLTDAYAAKEPMCKWPAVNGIVRKAIQSNKYTDAEIEAALLRLAAEGRSVTIDALRMELQGLPPLDRQERRAGGLRGSSSGARNAWQGPQTPDEAKDFYARPTQPQGGNR